MRASVSPGQRNLQSAPGAHEMEQVSVQVTSHTEPSLQLTLPLAPKVTVQLAWAPHSMLHDSPQLPVQELASRQVSEQLDGPHESLEKLHV